MEMEGNPGLLWSGFPSLSVFLKHLSVCILGLAITKAGGGDMINANPLKSEADKGRECHEPTEPLLGSVFMRLLPVRKNGVPAWTFVRGLRDLMCQIPTFLMDPKHPLPWQAHTTSFSGLQSVIILYSKQIWLNLMSGYLPNCLWLSVADSYLISDSNSVSIPVFLCGSFYKCSHDSQSDFLFYNCFTLFENFIHAYVFSSDPSFHSLPLQSLFVPWKTTFSSPVLFKKVLNPLSPAYMCTHVEPSVGAWVTSQSCSNERNWLSSPQQPSNAKSSSCWVDQGGTYKSFFFSSVLGGWLTQLCVGSSLCKFMPRPANAQLDFL